MECIYCLSPHRELQQCSQHVNSCWQYTYHIQSMPKHIAVLNLRPLFFSWFFQNIIAALGIILFKQYLVETWENCNLLKTDVCVGTQPGLHKSNMHLSCFMGIIVILVIMNINERKEILEGVPEKQSLKCFPASRGSALLQNRWPQDKTCRQMWVVVWTGSIVGCPANPIMWVIYCNVRLLNSLS